MSGCEAKVPALRFRGYPGAWEKNRLGDVFNLDVSTNTLSRSELSQTGLVRDIHYGDVLIKYGSVLDVSDEDVPFVSNSKFKCDRNNRLLDGDIIMADTAEDETAGKVTEIRGADKHSVVSGLHTIVLRPNEEYAEGFLGYCLNAPSFHCNLISFLQGAKVLSINKGTLVDMEFFAPPTEHEQRRIGSFFRSLDALIAGREKALEKLEALKKSMLLKMFPQGDATVPEVRFKGFAGDWEKKRLEDVADFNPKCTLPNSFEYVDLESVVGTEILTHRSESKTTAPSRAQRLAKFGDVFYQTVRPYQKNNCIFTLTGTRPFVFSTGYAQLRPKCDGYFLLSLLQNDLFVNRVLDECTGTSYPAINDSRLSDIPTAIPSDKNEQQKIGAYFRSLDALLASRREEIGKLKQMKKALLERMFV